MKAHRWASFVAGAAGWVASVGLGCDRALADAAQAASPALQVGATDATAPGPQIAHDPVGCVMAGRFPRIEARAEAADGVARVRTYFRAENGLHWYFVEMADQGGLYSTLLPKPKKTTARIRYYVLAVGRGFAESRTIEHAPVVVSGLGACQDRKLAAALPSATLRIGRDPGAPPVPEGFLAAGIETARSNDSSAGASSGGWSRKTKRLAGAGAAAVVIGAVALAGGGAPPPPVVDSVRVSPEGPVLASATTITFTASASDPGGASLTYTWDFGDGSTGAGPTTTHVYPREGSFAPAVTVSNGKASARGIAPGVAVRSLSGTWSVSFGSSRLQGSLLTLTQSSGAVAGQRSYASLAAPINGSVSDPRGVTLSSAGTSAQALRPSYFARDTPARLRPAPRTPWFTRLLSGVVGWPSAVETMAVYTSALPTALISPMLLDAQEYPPYPSPPAPAPTPTRRPRRPSSPYEVTALCPFTASLTLDTAISQATGMALGQGPCADIGTVSVTMMRQ